MSAAAAYCSVPVQMSAVAYVPAPTLEGALRQLQEVAEAHRLVETYLGSGIRTEDLRLTGRAEHLPTDNSPEAQRCQVANLGLPAAPMWQLRVELAGTVYSMGSNAVGAAEVLREAHGEEEITQQVIPIGGIFLAGLAFDWTAVNIRQASSPIPAV